MPQKLDFHKVSLKKRTGALMLVEFLDRNGDLYDWAPKWNDIREIFKKAINVERFNKPESDFLNDFSNTINEVVEGAQRLESGYKLRGQLEKYEEQRLLLRTGTTNYVKLTPSFDVTFEFLDTWLDRDVEALVINDMCVKLQEVSYNKSGGYDYKNNIYPNDDFEVCF